MISCHFSILSSGRWVLSALVLLIFIPAAQGQSKGSSPQSGLTLGKDDNLYGTTSGGGKHDVGTVFKITPAGRLTTLYSFHGETTASDPCGGLLQGKDGNFYGTTFGVPDTNIGGIVFKITPRGKLTILHRFIGSNGAHPESSLTQGKDGNFYGTTSEGGKYGDGTVFKITSAGKLTVLHEFNGATGQRPLNGLTQGKDGNLYGTTYNGGKYDSGTIFKITPAGNLTILHSFSPLSIVPNGKNAEGAYPVDLIQGKDGNFYGAAIGGGKDGDGTVFTITPSGMLSTLYTFRASNGDDAEGGGPSGLTQGKDGNFYGTTGGGGKDDNGTVFKLTPTGQLTALHSFGRTSKNRRASNTDGAIPNGGLAQGKDGNFYGTTLYGGSNGAGVVFKITPTGRWTTLFSFSR